MFTVALWCNWDQEEEVFVLECVTVELVVSGVSGNVVEVIQVSVGWLD